MDLMCSLDVAIVILLGNHQGWASIAGVGSPDVPFLSVQRIANVASRGLRRPEKSIRRPAEWMKKNITPFALNVNISPKMSLSKRRKIDKGAEFFKMNGGWKPVFGVFTAVCVYPQSEMVCPEKRQAFANISLTRNTVADRISDILADLESQLNHKIQPFIAFSAATDESTDITDVAQLAAFICGVDDTWTVAEEFVELVPMMDTTHNSS